MDVKMLILSAIIAFPVTAFIKYGFKYLTDRRINIIVEESINRMLADDSFRKELMEHVGQIVAERVNFLVEVTHGQER